MNKQPNYDAKKVELIGILQGMALADDQIELIMTHVNSLCKSAVVDLRNELTEKIDIFKKLL